MTTAIGLDFGTTNSALAWVTEGNAPVLSEFEVGDLRTPTFRSVLYFDRDEDQDVVLAHAGPFAIERYLEAEEKNGRLIQSLKSFLASRLLPIDLDLRRGPPARAARGGHPHPAPGDLGADTWRADHPRRRGSPRPLRQRARAGRRRARTEAAAGRRAESILGHDGVPVAGDAFGRLIRHLVAPRLGRGDEFRSFFGRVLPIPTWIYTHLERWHHLSFLKSKKTLELLLDLRREALEPEKIDALLHVVENDLGFLLFRAVEATKQQLSLEEEARFRFGHEDLEIECPVSRQEFEGWIRPELEAMGVCVDRLLSRSGRETGEIDRVFLTGGSSFVPAVRRLFEERFGADRLRTGGELTLVASGLALRALEEA